MARTTVPLTLDLYAELDSPCRACLFWECEPMHRSGLSAAERTREKHAWISQVLREWGSCGRIAMVDRRPVGYLIYAPAALVPGAAAFPTAPVSADAVLMTTAWVDPSYDGDGLGRLLVQGMASDLVGRTGSRQANSRQGNSRQAGSREGSSIRAIEAFARTRAAEPHHGARGPCVLPADFLARVGFKTQRSHPRSPRMRMDMRSLVTWRDEFEAAWERLVDVVRRPSRHPAPVPRDARSPRT
ncbi:MAG: GNAT family N-acetyltransferase [Nocardioidaceae bacterium]|nr:GNAT family N-acetyltransferase [Nocardioidaceae bacterium]